MTERADAHYTKNLLNHEDVNITANNSSIEANSSKRKRRGLIDDPALLKLLTACLGILCISLAVGLITSLLLKANDKTCPHDLNEIIKNATPTEKATNKNKSLTKPEKHQKPSNLNEQNLPIETALVQGNSKWNHSRLPVNFKPSLYTLEFRIDVINKEFYGNCTIQFECLKNAPFLVLHLGENIVFSESTPFPMITEIDSESNVIGKLDVVNLEMNQFYTYVIIVLAEKDSFKQGSTYLINFENYHSNITNNLKGLYYSTYATEDGEIRPLVVSQLQPLDARSVFPSFDEPNLKARFAISIQHQKAYTALSNMEEISVDDLDETWRRTQFNTTPIMSTYILAFVVSDFEHVTVEGPNSLQIRVWTRSEYINNTDYILNYLPKAYYFYQDYFNISEVVTKADHFAAPDFNAGAMENWGLVLYRESALVYDKEKSLLEDEFFVLLVMCHEVSHSWFGNMATLRWWNDVWLNEAFANTLMYFAMDHLQPDFHVQDTLVVHDIFAVMEKDSVETTHPVSTHVEDPRQVQQYFDEISYEKGLAVLRMLRGFIGNEDFQQSIRNHINKFMFSNCEMNDLFEVISDTVDNKFNVSNIMNGWLTQKGYPIVNVSRRVEETKIVYELRQEYFILFQTEATKESYLWTIPFTYKTESEGRDTSNLVWMNTSAATIEVEGGEERDWFVGNVNFMGYYRVNYDAENWRKIIGQLKKDHTVFTPVERAVFIYDAFTFARIGYIDYSIALDLASYLVNEEDYVPWKSYFKSITYIDNLLSTSSCYGLFQHYGAAQLSKIYQKLGWNDEGTFLERLLRAHVLKYSAYFENEDATEKSKELFRGFMKSKIEPPKHVKEAAFCTGIKYSNPKQWLEMLNLSLNAQPAVQNVIWQSLVCSKDLWVLKSFVEMTLDEKLIRRSDIRRVYSYYGLTALSRSVYFDFIMKNWETLYKNFINDAFIISSILETLSIGITDKFSLGRVEALLLNGAGSASNTPDFIINQIKTNIDWFDKYETKICDFLSKSSKIIK